MARPKGSRRTPDPAEIERIVAVARRHPTFVSAARELNISPNRVQQAVYRVEGKCRCGRRPENGLATCPTCLDRAKAHSARKHAARAASGVCRECGEPLAPTSRRFCPIHLEQLRSNQANLRARRRAAGSCEFCWNPRTDGSRYCEKHAPYTKRMNMRGRSNAKFGGLLEAVLERDGQRCRICSDATARIEVHHIDGHTNSMENLITLCTYCHSAITFLNCCRDANAVWTWFQQHPPVPRSAD